MLFSEGDAGPGVRDIQRRLLALGDLIDERERATMSFGASTVAAVRAFQQRRGLVVDAKVGRETWRELVEASWQLGDRLLYIRSPQMRGDDVRELQQRLSRLGFDPGRIDGILGPQTVRALVDFQRNFGLPPDGIVGAATVRSLVGMPSFGGSTPVTLLREREARRQMPPTLQGLTIVLDPGHGRDDPGNVSRGGLREDVFAMTIARALESALAAAGVAVFLTRDDASTPTDSERAALANALEADLFVALHAGGSDDPAASGVATFYFGNESWESEAGKGLADAIQDGLVGLGLVDGRTDAKTWGVLRETRMPAVQAEIGFLSNPEEESMLAEPGFPQKIADAIFAALRRFASAPRDAA